MMLVTGLVGGSVMSTSSDSDSSAAEEEAASSTWRGMMEEFELAEGMRTGPDFLGERRTGRVPKLDGPGESLGVWDLAFCAIEAPPTPRLRSFGFGAAGLTSIESSADSSESDPIRLITLPCLKAESGAAAAPCPLLNDCAASLGDADRPSEEIARSNRLRFGSLSFDMLKRCIDGTLMPFWF